MWKNYLKTAWRNVLKNKLRTVIHVLGLAIGVSVCFIIFNTISFSYSFDRFHPNSDRIFQVTTLTSYYDQSWPNSGVPFPLGEVIQEDLTGLADVTHFYTLYQTFVKLSDEEKSFGRTDNVMFSDPAFFRLFEREWLAGNPSVALEEPYAVVLTEARAQTYFPELSAVEVLGKELLYVNQDSVLARVTGVVRDFSKNTDFTFTDFISKSTIETLDGKRQFATDNWNSVNSSSQLFVLLEDGQPNKEIEAGLAKIADKYVKKEEGSHTEFFVQPLSELHFTQPYTTQRASKSVLKGLTVIGIILLVIACLNFINLETAEAINRSKEVGIRKTLGSNRGQLIAQFLMETFVLVVMAIVVSFFLVHLMASYFADYLPKGMDIAFFSWENVVFLLGLSIVLTFLSGIYPAFVMGNYQPDHALRPDRTASKGFSFGLFLRKNLTVIQFTLSIAFIIGVLAINKQIRFLHDRELGFDKEAILYARTPYLEPSRVTYNLLIKEKLEQQAFVQGVSLSNEMVASSSLWTTSVKYSHEDEKQEYQVQVKVIDEGFVEVNGLEILAGRNIREVPGEVLVNQALLHELGLETPEDLIGNVLEYNEKELKIVGVVKDFHSRPLRESILPIIMFHETTPYQVVNVRLEGGTSLVTAKNKLDEIYKEFYPLEESGFAFLDEEIDRFYRDDAKMQDVLAFASGLAILISCMGLFGLTLFTVSKRLKEVSIRKVLGASISQILILMSKEYVALILIAFVLGSIPAWIFLDNWLQTFSYKIDMPWGLFIVSGITVLVLCLMIVGLHSVNAAQKNPAHILKSE